MLTNNTISKLFKLAYTMDKDGHFDEAKAIEAVMKDLVSRVGLNINDLVSLADYFDSCGETAVANKLDNIIATSKQAANIKIAVDPMSYGQKQEHDRMVKEFLEKERAKNKEKKDSDDNEKARQRMQRLRQDRAIEEAVETKVVSDNPMCEEHKDIPAAFILQTLGQFPGLKPRTALCPFCAAKLDIQPIVPDKTVNCVNVGYHANHPIIDPLATAALLHNGLFGEDTGPIPLCKECSSQFAIQVRPLNETADEKFSHMVPLLNRKKAFLLSQLVKLANLLDSSGLYVEANEIDSLIRCE